MKILIYTIFILVTFSACNKFEHQAQTVPACTFCDYASTLEGSYRGYAVGESVPNNSDSVTITLEQIFLGDSQIDDSLRMRFKAYFAFDASPTLLIDTIQLMGTSGSCRANPARTFTSGAGNFDFGNPNYVVTPDSIFIAYSEFLQGGGEVIYFSGSFYK